jgi:hypothetical protein
MSLGQMLDATEFQLERLLRDIQGAIPRAGADPSVRQIDSMAHTEFERRLSEFETRLKSLETALSRADSHIGGRAFLARQAPPGDARFRARQSANTFRSRHDQLGQLAREVNKALLSLAGIGLMPTLADGISGIREIELQIKAVRDAIDHDGGQTVQYQLVRPDADMLLAKVAAKPPPGEATPLTIVISAVILMVRFFKARRAART